MDIASVAPSAPHFAGHHPFEVLRHY